MKKLALPGLLLSLLALTGCATTVDNVKPEDDRETKDGAYLDYLNETYGEEYPDLNPTAVLDFSLRFCSVLENNQVSPAEIDVWLTEEEGLSGRGLESFEDMLYTGVKVYCPQHLTTVEHMRPVA